MITNVNRKINIDGEISIAAGITALSIMLLTVSASAATLTVDDSGGADYTMIQDAINNASAGDTIEVYSGTYNENVIVFKQLTLRGLGMPVVNAGGSGSAITLSADGITLVGFTATGGGYYPEAGIMVSSNNTTLTGNNVSSNRAYGIYQSPYTSSNKLTGNNASNNYIGIRLSPYTSSNNLSANFVSSNSGIGIYLSDSGNNNLSDNIMLNNRLNFGVDGWDNSHFNNNIDTSNTVDGKPIYYLQNVLDRVYDASANVGTFYCINCNNITVRDSNLTNNLHGVFFWNTSNSIIENVETSSNYDGIYLAAYSKNNMLSTNFVSSNDFFGIALINSGSNVLSGNIMINNLYNFGVRSWEISGYINNNINISNTVNGKPIYYLQNVSDRVYDASAKAGTFYCINCINITIRDFVLTNNEYGLFFWNTSNSIIENVSASNNEVGIYLESSSSNNNLSGSNASNNWDGIYLVSSSNNTLTGNNASYNGDGIDLYLSSNFNTLSNNIASNNIIGIWLQSSSNNTLNGNNASNNNNYGINLESSSNNTIYDNIFNNTNNFYFSPSNINTWNTTLQSSTNIIGGSNLGGNFWANPGGTGFSQTCADADMDGICDLNYTLDTNNIDYLPLKSHATITVNASGGANYTRIQDAINNATAGDTIEVYGGTYYENVNVTKQLTLRGIGMPVVDARGSGSVITLSADGIILEGFTAIGGRYFPEAGIMVTSNNSRLIGNNVSSNQNNGIYLSYNTNNNTLIGNNVSNNLNTGIHLYSSSNNTLSGNNVSNNKYYGISLAWSSNNLLNDNILINNRYNFNIEGWHISHFINDIDTSNTVNSKPIYYLQNVKDTVYDASANAGTFYCINCNNITVRDFNLTNNRHGVYFYNTSNSLIDNVIASNNGEGITLGSFSNYNILSGNNASNNWYGIKLLFSRNNDIRGNNVSNNDNGIYLESSDRDNTIYNNIFNNTNNFGFFYGSNIDIWNITRQSGTNIIGGSNIGGNFWAYPNGTGFSQKCTDADNDGICDLQYNLSESNIDYLPLKYLNTSSNASDNSSPIVTNASSSHEIPDDTDNEPLWGETAQLNVTVTDESNISSVTINLSEIGGSSAKPMLNIGGNIYSTTTNASAGTPPKVYNLTVNATDVYGNSNISSTIRLKVMKNGDCTGNGSVNIGDALRLANNVSHPGNSNYILSSPYVCEVTGNAVINIGDALRLANNVSHPGNLAYILK